ncbi:response regulator [Asaia prunellae]|uniref:response regulator n=1 Tax=Asaia prunellae TaxID=610245 RepID=UPI0004710456|nr:response regulator [Asaia prunellae]
MNLELGILWIEDSFSPEEETNLKRCIQEVGFLAEIKNIVNGEEIETLAKQNNLFHCYDLILLDFALKGVNGDDLAPKIRDLFPSTTILFYSGNFEKETLLLKIAEKKVEGVYCCTRDRFIERAGILIEQTARTLDRLSGMRGLAMRVVAECDAIMKEAVIYLSATDDSCAAILTEMDNDVFEHIDEVKKRYQASMGNSVQARLDTFAVDSAKLFAHFRRLSKKILSNPNSIRLSTAQIDELRNLNRKTSNYVVAVLNRRNALGHAKEMRTAEGWKLDGNSGIKISDFPMIRRDFAVYKEAFESIRKLITSSDK